MKRTCSWKLFASNRAICIRSTFPGQFVTSRYTDWAYVERVKRSNTISPENFPNKRKDRGCFLGQVVANERQSQLVAMNLFNKAAVNNPG